MGAIFRDKKKSKLFQWKVYKVNYTWNKYSVSTSTSTTYSKITSGTSSYLGLTVGNTISKTATINTSSSIYQYHVVATSYTYNSGFYAGSDNSILNRGTESKIPSYYKYWLLNKSDFQSNVSYPFQIVASITSWSSGTNTYTMNGKIIALMEKTTTTTYSKGSTSYGTVTSNSKSTYPTNGADSNKSYWYVYTGYSKGDYVETVSAKEGTYPDDGIQGNYYYELV